MSSSFASHSIVYGLVPPTLPWTGIHIFFFFAGKKKGRRGDLSWHLPPGRYHTTERLKDIHVHETLFMYASESW